MRTRALTLAAVLVAAAGLAACGNPCSDLANQICSCQQNDALVQACNNKVSTDTYASSPTAAQRDRCSALLDTCTCSALACGNLAACGLARDPGIDLGTQTCP